MKKLKNNDQSLNFEEHIFVIFTAKLFHDFIRIFTFLILVCESLTQNISSNCLVMMIQIRLQRGFCLFSNFCHCRSVRKKSWCIYEITLKKSLFITIYLLEKFKIIVSHILLTFCFLFSNFYHCGFVRKKSWCMRLLALVNSRVRGTNAKWLGWRTT